MHDGVFSHCSVALSSPSHDTRAGSGGCQASMGRQRGGRQQGRQLLLCAEDGGCAPIPAPRTTAPGEGIMSSVPRMLRPWPQDTFLLTPMTVLGKSCCCRASYNNTWPRAASSQSLSCQCFLKSLSHPLTKTMFFSDSFFHSAAFKSGP